MKRKLTLLLTAMMLLTFHLHSRADEVTYVMSSMGWTNGQVVGSGTFDSKFSYNSGTGDDGASEGPKYYTSGSAVRFYAKNGGTGLGNWMQVAPIGSYTITGIELTAISSYTPTVKCVVDNGTEIEMTLSGTTYSLTGISATERVKFWDAALTNTQLRITQIKVTYTTGGGQQTVATPTFDPAGGTYFDTQTVSISCTTENASIYYTNDGTDPTESSTLYSSPISVSETTTLKAKAFKTGSTPSAVASATYTFPSLVTIAEARALADNQYALVQGIVTFIEGKNVYIQDNTGGIDLFLNANASGIALGDEVKAYGMKTVYKGLVELTGINQSSSDFSILSNGNALPLAVKTIAEVLAGGSGDLQCTRVKIESATIGAINTGGNTPLTQGESTTNIYKVPALTGINENDVVDVIGVIGYYNAPQIRVAFASDVTLSYTPDPQLIVNPTQLTGFQYTYGAGPSQPLTFTVSGSDLESNVTITASQDYEITLNPEGLYFNTLNPETTGGTLDERTIYVRMKANLAVGSHAGTITLAAGTANATVTLSGTVNEQPTAATPTFTPAGGTFITEQNVSISTTTADATIYYTTDGTEPTESSSVYSEPITVSTTTTLKAIAVAEGYQNSAVAEATYTINEPMTIAEARALANDDYACVEGTVTYMEGRNVYIQDATAGIDLYLNSNTVPTTLALGDNVRAYGKKTTYNGLVELTAINGNNANVFAIISTGNPLPLATKTIAEINDDYSGSNLLQATRVKIEHAIIGAINPSGTTVIAQESNTLNVYHIPTVPGMIQGDWVTITGVIGCYNAPQLLVASADDIQYTHRPTLTANPTNLNGLDYEFEQGGPSDVASFNLSGQYLLGNVRVYPSENYELSTFGGSQFHPENPATIFSHGHFTDITIYVRLKAGLEGGTYTEQQTIVSQDADTLYVTVTGTVTGAPLPPDPPTPPTPGDGNYVRISDLGQLTEGNYVVFAARFDDNATDYYAMTASSSGKPTGVLFTSDNSGEDEVLPASIVDEEDNYYWTVGVTANGYTFTNAAGELIGYSSSTNFATGGDNTEWTIALETAGESAMVPNYNGFVIRNFNNNGRAFALNSNHNFGPYSFSNNSNNSGYNFYLDIFLKTEGGDPPTPTVATPTFTPEAGTYFEEQTVTINCSTEGATIYYSTESENGPWTAYTTPITVSETMTIWAYAEKEGYNNSAVAEATYTIQMGFVTIFNQDWEGEMNGWTFVDVEGEMEWVIAEHNGNHYAYANGYNHGANEDWCISPAFNLDAYSNAVLTFRTAKNYTGNDLQVYFSNDYDGEDPTSATWTMLACNLSQGSWNWVESGDINLSTFSGTNCYIGFKYTCEESSAAGWEVDDILLLGQTSEPVVTVMPLTLAGFTYMEGNGPSAEQSFTVSGFNLTGDVTINNAAHYEISLTSGTNFNAQSTITLAPVAGNIEETTIYVRLMAGLAAGDYNDEDITVNCVDVEDFEVTCSGNVTEQPVPGGDYVRIYDPAQLVAGNQVILAVRYNETVDAYRAIGNTLTSGRPATTEFTSEMNGDDEIIPADILADEESYYWTVDVTSDGYTFTNPNGDMIGYGNSGTTFVMNGEKTEWTIETGTSDPSSLVPDYFGFNIVNTTATNRGFAIRYYNEGYTCGAYSTSNMTGSQADQYNFFLDIFMQGEGGVPPTPTVAAPTFTPAAGTYYETIDVTISCATDGATIYYSLESGIGPWDEYVEPITVDENMTIWAYAAKEGYNDSPVVSADYVIMNDIVVLFNQDWEDDWNGWTEVLVYGDSLWRIASYQGNHYAYANGYNHPATEDWLISPAFDLDSYTDVVLTFLTAKNYTGLDLEVFFSNNYDGGDPTLATWTQLPCELSAGSWNWVPSGDISLDEFTGTNCHIGFRYQCTDDEAAGWEVDDIMLVSGGSAGPVPTLIATPNTINALDYMEGEGPSESQSYTLTGANLEGEGDITVTVSENFEISLDDEEYFIELTIPFADGELIDQPVTVYVRLVEGLEVGSYTGTITHIGGGVSAGVTVSGTVHSENEPMISVLMPLYIQGNNGSNNNRVPMAAPVQFANFEPNTTYRYTNQFVVSDDGPETAGAGNVIYANPEGFYRSTSPSLATEGGYGEFTTNDEGYALVWLMNEPTANARFTPGNQVYMRVRLNDGNDGTTVEQIFTSEDYATVLNFGTENDEYSGSAFYVKSNEAAMSFAFMYSDYENERPAYATSIETIGVDYAGINQYADFYKELVAGNDGWFGGILPNNNETGITYIVTSSMDFQTINEYNSEDGQWFPEANTINPTNGLDEPIFIDLTDNGVNDLVEANVKVWNANNEFVIENGDETRYTMNVVNVLGQTLMTREIAAGSAVRISHNLVPGIYVISLQNNHNTVAVKVMVK